MHHAFRSPLLFLILACSATLAFAQDDVSTGPAPLLPSSTPSAYMQGIGEGAQTPVQLRIMGVRITKVGLIVDALLLDANGNALGTMFTQGTWSAKLGCRAEPLSTHIVPTVEQATWRSDTPPRFVEVLIDHSLTSRDLADDALESLGTALATLKSSDSIGVTVFDQSSLEITPFAPPVTAGERCAAAALAPPAGVPAVYTAMMNGMRVFENHTAGRNILVVVTASNDMASLSYSTLDVVNKAREHGVRVYVVKVGNNAYGYVYRYMSSATGGRLYTIPYGSVATSVGAIVSEILYASKQHLEAFLPFKEANYACDDLLLHVGWAMEGSSQLADTILVPLRDKAFRTTSATVAAFADTTDRALKDYYSILAVVAEELMSDSTKRIRLTGHVSADIAGDNIERGMERARNVSGYLKAYGVKEKQIEVQSAGSSKPLYYLQLDGAQRLLNNRVEASYLLPDDLPYTIVVERVATEEQAISRMDNWTAKGYKAYFEPAVHDAKPAYDVILWGYRTQKDAERDLKTLGKFGVKNATIR